MSSALQGHTNLSTSSIRVAVQLLKINNTPESTFTDRIKSLIITINHRVSQGYSNTMQILQEAISYSLHKYLYYTYPHTVDCFNFTVDHASIWFDHL